MSKNCPPPCDLDAEAAVLSTAILDGGVWAAAQSLLKPHHFYSDANKLIFGAVLALTDAATPVDAVTIASRLKERRQLDAVGGTPYLHQIINATPAVAHVEEHAQIVRDLARRREAIHTAQKLHAEAQRPGTDGDSWFAAAAETIELARGDTPLPGSMFRDRCLSLAEHPEFLSEPPPPQEWLLTQFHDRRTHGVFPRGRVGLLTGTGGTGKTYALLQLAIAIAAGGYWLDTFRAERPGQVLLALAEEDAEEARRRLWRAANAATLSAEERETMASRLHLLPLHGLPVALTASHAPGTVVETETASELRELLHGSGLEWDLVVLDPLSRWAGGGVEGDNEAATRFVQVVEKFTTAPGRPAVLLAHHSSKTSTKDGASDARGVTGIRDGFRWMATLDNVVTPDGARGILLRNRKSNYSLEFDDVVLVRNTEPGIEGTLRAATDTEASRLLQQSGRQPVPDEELEERVLATVQSRPGLTSAGAIIEYTDGKRQKLFATIKAMRLTGKIVLTKAGFVVPGSRGEGGEPR